MNKSKLKTK